MHVDANFVVSKGHERTLDDPEVLQTESLDLCDEICLLLRRIHRGLHAAAANRLTLRRGSRAKNPPSVDATFHDGKLAAAAVASLFVLRNGAFRGRRLFQACGAHRASFPWSRVRTTYESALVRRPRLRP